MQLKLRKLNISIYNRHIFVNYTNIYLSSPFRLSGAIDVLQFDNSEDHINNELEKQRRKLRDITRALDQQHQLLRLIIQKMEIKTEADDVDEGVSPGDFRDPSSRNSNSTGSRWTSPRIRNKLRAALSFNKGM